VVEVGESQGGFPGFFGVETSVGGPSLQAEEGGGNPQNGSVSAKEGKTFGEGVTISKTGHLRGGGLMDRRSHTREGKGKRSRTDTVESTPYVKE